MSKDKNIDAGLPFDVWHSMRVSIVSLSIVVAILSLLFVGSLAYAIKVSTEKQTVKPIFYRISDAERQIVRIEQGNMSVSKSKLLRSYTLREHVINREMINHIDEPTRYKKVKAQSSDEVWRDFRARLDPNQNKNSPLANKNFIRKIKILLDFPIKTNNKYSLHRIEFQTIDSIEGTAEEPTIKTWVALIQYDVSDAYMTHNDRFLNIDGVKIINYQLNPLN